MADQFFTVNSGFYDAVDYDRTYSADDMTRPYRRVVSDGVFATQYGDPSTDLQVKSAGGMKITVSKGEGICGQKWFENPAALAITVPANTTLYRRIDSVIMQVDKTEAVRAGRIVYRTGTAAQSPTAPALSTNPLVVEYRLANISVAANATVIRASNITDMRGSADCPWVTGVITQVDTSTLFAQYQAAYSDFFAETTAEFGVYMDHQRESWEDFLAQLTSELDVTPNVLAYTSTYTATGTVSNIPIGIAMYNADTDELQVYINGIFAPKTVRWTLNNNKTSVTLTDAISAGDVVNFVVFKSVVTGNLQSIKVALDEINDRLSVLNYAYGSPLAASTVAGMTDTTKIYVYTGSETGYTAGNWYYWNGSAWESGGVYNAVALQTDTTLTVSGAAADSKATGDRFGQVDTEFNDIGVLFSPYYDIKDFDWATVGNASYPKGWRTGYWDDGSSVSSARYIRTIYGAQFDSSVTMFHVKAPLGRAIKVSVFDSSNNFIEDIGVINTELATATNEITIYVTPTYKYTFSVGRWPNDDAADALTDSFISQIEFKYWQISCPYLERTGEMEFFTVVTNVSPSANGTGDTNQEGYTAYTANAVISLPTNYNPYGDPVPLIMLCHGQSARVNATDRKWFGNSADFLRLLRGFTGAGYAVFDVGSTNPDNPDIAFADWGNPALMGAYIKAWEYVKAHYNVEHRLFIYSESMGTMAALNMLKWYPSDIVTAINSAPRTNLEKYVPTTTMIGGYSVGDAIRLRYGFTDASELPHRLIGYDNYHQIVTISGTDYVFHQFPPVKVLAGGDDDANDNLLETRAYYAALINSGNVINYREVAGVNHHDMCYLITGDTLQECVDWFNRFR